ncbi:hypothetical protein [Rhizobium leguminosarum]|uniref:hypothetical protein n=1 Tax=Rhizobium leguminosarum TaxID=384 RepID=UPI001C97EDE4|nr:hypothetical protein [Rhizobium leguminosarum]MBY5523333.1 hypothetical protein [Rhizobium leguminosarum]
MWKDDHRANMPPLGRWRAGTLAAAALLAAAVAPSPAAACGYENPNDIALGLLNWVFPKALYVRTAVWQAEQAGMLPPRPEIPAKRDLFGSGFRRAAESMTGLGVRMNAAASATGKSPSFSVVLIPAVMWTTFTPTAGGYSVHVHADGPAKGDIVIVTDEKVVRALVDGSFDAAAAESHGLVRLYGPANGQDRVRAALPAPPATPSRLGDRGIPALQAEESDPLYCGPGDHDVLILQEEEPARLYSLPLVEQK